MYLKSLILKGFKSFADRSVLALEPGVSVVVGPNGSGKSNISDAVLWVLGEQSAKSLRGQAMEDVIFAGSAARKAVGVAEVDLVLDNSDGTLPLEFSEVTITRRMFRNGESEYLINQTPARLMDVQDLLHDSGLGRDTHSIISQGRLEEVLNSRPEERRALIEEAAGVLKHKKRKDRAARKLNSMDAHLGRAKDISSEIERQLRPLQRQASRAQTHQELNAELRAIEIQLAVDDLTSLRAEWDAAHKRQNEADADIDLSRYRLSEKERELEKFQSLLEEKGLFVGDLSEQRRRLQSVLERLNSGLLLLEEKGKNLIDRLSDLRAKLHHSESRVAARTAESQQLADDRAETDGRLKALYGQLSELRRESETVRKSRLAADEKLSTVSTELRRATHDLEQARAEHATIEQALAAFRLEEELLAEREASIHEQREAARSALSARRARLDQLEAAIARSRREQALADSDVDKRVRVLESRRKELAEAKDTLAEVRAAIRGLEEVDRAFETASPALAWALSNQDGLPGLIGPVAESIKAPAPYERLVEQMLGSDLFALLVTDTSAAAGIAARVRAEAEGDISLLPLSGSRPRLSDRPSSGTCLAEVVTCPAEHRPAIEALLGDVYVVDTLEDALIASAKDTTGTRFVTPDGTVVWPTGKISLGSMVQDSEGVLTRKRRINELQDEYSAHSATLGDAEAAVAQAEEALAAAQHDALDISQRLATLAGENDSLREDLGRLESTLTGLESDSASVAKRVADIRERVAKDSPGLEEVAARIQELVDSIAALDEEATAAREARDLRFREEAAVSERLSSCQVDIAAVSEREVHLKRQLASITAELTELDEALVAARETERALELLRERIQPVHDLYRSLLERAEHWAIKLKDRARFEQADSESLRETIHVAQEAVRSAQAEIDEKMASMGDLRVEKGQIEIQVNQAVRRLVEELGIPVERAPEIDPVDDRQAAEERALALRKRIANLGPVNPIAMEEFEALAARREFMRSQIEDLESSRKALHKVIAAIDRKIRDRFLETFEQVDQHFQEVFGALFPGGHAQLTLTDPDDPETTGVEVVAQPRGKKLSKMSLLSGGEKSLTALALLFAVYRTRPCPFYILDEVEAALDDTNLRRFVTFVDGMRKHTQFVVVTHQRRTMEMADVLYGVTMQADGVSKVVSQKLQREGSEPADERAMV